MSKIVIVSKTKMANNRICVGGIDLENKMSVRLLDANGYHEFADSCAFNVRDIWEIEYLNHNQRPLPHSEDVRVISKQKSGVLKRELSMLDLLNKFQLSIYRGGILNTFEGKLRHTSSGTFYVSEDNVPTNSTCFWICDKEIIRSDYNGKLRYCYNDGTRQWGYNITYVGLEENPAQIIPQGTLVRLSLAHWWSPENADTEDRCYLQLSGWY